MSEVKVNKISPRSGTDVTLGDSGDTFTIPSGATINNQGTAVNFGATGSASWVTTVKTSTFTAVAGEGYFVNTTGGAVTVNLPAGTAGAVVAVKDYANTFDTNAVTLNLNGSDKIGGSAVNATLNTEGLAVTLVFVDSTQGWLVTDNGTQDTAPTSLYVTATGGTITCSGNFRIHTFTGPGTFAVSCVGNASGSNTVDYMVTAGGGGAGVGGGGGGGFRESPGTASGSYTVSPLGASPAVALPVSGGPFPIAVGAGGASTVGNNNASNGLASVFSSITSAGGGGGGTYKPSGCTGQGSAGGSGGGGGAISPPSNTEAGGTGNTPPTNPPQGKNGGAGSYDGPTHTAGGGGGGASAAGTAAPGNGGPTTSSAGGLGGNGVTTSITGSAIARSGGGGGGVNTTGNTGPFPGGTGGGGAGVSPPGGTGTVGTTNTGGGGGGGSPGSCKGANGGSGIVVIRYKFQN